MYGAVFQKSLTGDHGRRPHGSAFKELSSINIHDMVLSPARHGVAGDQLFRQLYINIINRWKVQVFFRVNMFAGSSKKIGKKMQLGCNYLWMNKAPL